MSGGSTSVRQLHEPDFVQEVGFGTGYSSLGRLRDLPIDILSCRKPSGGVDSDGSVQVVCSARKGQLVAATIPARRHWRSPGVIALAVALTAPFTASREARAIEPAEMQPHRQTVADIKAVSAAIISWIIDQVSLQASGEILGAGTVDVADFPPITVAALEARLVPAYIADVPELDGWGNPYEYYLDLTPTEPQGVTLIRSVGEDGVYEGDVYVSGDVEALWEDLVWADGIDVRRPGISLIDLRARAVRAHSEVTRVGLAMMSWLSDQVCFAPPAESADGPTTDLDLFTPITFGDLEVELVPIYISSVPENDPWGSPYDYYLDAVCPFSWNVAAIRCLGKGAMAEGTVYTPDTFPASDLDRDLVWADGSFVRQPDDLSALVFLDDFEVGDARHWSALEP